MKAHTAGCLTALCLSLSGPLCAEGEPAAPAAPVVVTDPDQTAGTPPASADPKAALAALETRLKTLNQQAESDPRVASLKPPFEEADQKLQAAVKEASTRLDPEGRLDALRKEEKTADAARKAEIKTAKKPLEDAIMGDPAVAPLRAAREAARKALQDAKTLVLLELAPDYKDLEKQRGALKTTAWP